jgi:hypothetical protein
MDDPVKLIFKYKNNNKKKQYNLYIFAGNVPNKIKNILIKIKELSLYDSLINLTRDEYTVLKDFYKDDYWYYKFFILDHINYLINLIKKDNTLKNKLISKLSKTWFEDHIEVSKKKEPTIFYSYGDKVKVDIIKEEARKKKIKAQLNSEKEELVQTSFKVGGGDVGYMYDEDDNNQEDTEIEKVEDEDEKEEKDVTQRTKEAFDEDNERDEELIDLMIEEDIEEQLGEVGENLNKEATQEDNKNLNKEATQEDNKNLNKENIANLNINPEDINLDLDTPILDIHKTTKTIENILNNKKKKMILFDTSSDNSNIDGELRDVYNKNYIFDTYVYKDDTIKTIKNKITDNILNNPKFSNNAYIIPSRQYLWSQYTLNKNTTQDKVMIGQKWVMRTELLNIDIEPNKNIKIYEELRENFKFLRDSIRRQGKIKYSDDDFNILYDYENYYSNNEIFMIDIYNELGQNYNPGQQELINLTDVFFKIYFTKINQDDIKDIIGFLNNKEKENKELKEQEKITVVHEAISNDLLLENKIISIVEQAKESLKEHKYAKLFKENSIIQSTIHLDLLSVSKLSKINLFRIMDNFEVTTKYPFIQYQTLENVTTFKCIESLIDKSSTTFEDNKSTVLKWIDSSIYGISIKVLVHNDQNNSTKYIVVNINDAGKLNYKTPWREEDRATIQDIIKSYSIVRELLTKLNQELNRHVFVIPKEDDFKYTFLNTIQQFSLPEKFHINHNDLSDFSRYFFPYVSLVIEPRKRQAKIKKNNSYDSKFGTYLRYKRVTKYENRARIERRILFFLRNYDYTEQNLADEISKQFNISIEVAQDDIANVRMKYPTVKRSRNVLKKLDTVSKDKTSGISIEIQGKQRDKYKIRISGARSKIQLENISNFVNALLCLYIDTYLYKKPERLVLKSELKKLTNIPQLRNKVVDVVNYERSNQVVKTMEKLDKKRLGFKPEKGETGWSRSCQNSGIDNKRRPDYVTSEDELISKGFKLNKITKIYEKLDKKHNIIIKAVGLKGNESSVVYYYCNSETNSKNVHIGFLSKSNNPNNLCMPCCFKKDALLSADKDKRNHFKQCSLKDDNNKEEIIEDNLKNNNNNTNTNIGELLYILQDTNKLQPNRLGYLSKYLDLFFNYLLDKTNKIVQHQLIHAKDGYFFKIGSNQLEYNFLNALSLVLNITVEDIIKKIIVVMKEDIHDIIFTSLNAGDIKTQFKTRENYIKFIKSSKIIDYDLVANLLSIPKVMTQDGLNLIILKKRTTVINLDLQKKKLRDDFVICYLDDEVYEESLRTSIIIIKEEKLYNPIVLVTKDLNLNLNINVNNKVITLQKVFTYNKDRILINILEFYKLNKSLINNENESKNSINLTAKQTSNLLLSLDKEYEIKYKIKYQIIDQRNKCKYLITQNNSLIPVLPSSSLYNVSIIKIKNLNNKLLNFKQTHDNLLNLSNVSKLNVKPIGAYYIRKTSSSVTLVGVMISNKILIPIVQEETVSIKLIEKLNLILESRHIYDKIDEEILKQDELNKEIKDERILEVSKRLYLDEAYELFRLEFSEYLKEPDNLNVRKRILYVISNKKLTLTDKRYNIKKIVTGLIDKNLLETKETKEKEKETQVGGKYDKFITVITQNTFDKNITNYVRNNIREICPVHKKQDDCDKHKHCHWAYSNCYLGLTQQVIVSSINKLTEELISNNIKTNELLQLEPYFVSDIVDTSVYKEKKGQVIIKSTHYNINSILEELFGIDKVPTIGRTKTNLIHNQDANIEQLNIENPLQDISSFYLQPIVKENLSIIRAYSNAYYWNKLKFYDLESRNLGYFSILQTNIANYFRSLIVDEILKDLKDKDKSNSNNNNKIIFNLMKDENPANNNNGFLVLSTLNKINKLPIVVYSDGHSQENIIYLFDTVNKINYNKFDSKINIDNINVSNLENVIMLKFNSINNSELFSSIDVLYSK